MADNEEINPYEETTHRPELEPMSPQGSSDLSFEQTTRSRKTQNLGTRLEGPRMNNDMSRPNLVNEDGAYDPTKYISIVELENCHLKRRLEEANWCNAELESEAAVAKVAQWNNSQNQPNPGEREPQGKPRDSQTRGRRQPEGIHKTLRKDNLGKLGNTLKVRCHVIDQELGNWKFPIEIREVWGHNLGYMGHH
uniref:Uncharacterized protein n=1 Tax=Cannabis sativa TaxID=3483 RepID=A0A803Q7C1_CANSA